MTFFVRSKVLAPIFVSGCVFQFSEPSIQDKQITGYAAPYNQINSHDKTQAVFHFFSPRLIVCYSLTYSLIPQGKLPKVPKIGSA
jgi:hypothetical protein